MLSRFFVFFRSLDWGFAASIFLLAGLGLVGQYSLSFSRVQGEIFFARHAVFLIVGLVVFFVTASIDFRVWRDWRWFLYGAALAGLILVLLVGVTQRGTRGWLGYGFYFQFVEIVKPILAIVLASFWSARSFYSSRWQDLVLSAALAGLPVFLVIKQPDLGSAVLLGFIWLVMVLLIGLRFRTLAVFVLAALIGFGISWMFLLKPYQKDRLITFIYPQRDPYGQGYQIKQSIVAVGSGKFLGRGFGFGPQSQQRFLPEAHTDFIFAAIAEEFGFAGVTALFGALALFFYRLRILASRLRDDFGTLTLIGFTSLFIAQFWVNIAMNIGLAPVVGIPFPFVSYGGSSLLVSFLMAGILESMFIRSR